MVARAAKRPAVLPAPSWALRLALGDLSHLLLDSQNILPSRFAKLGFRYRFPNAEAAIGELFRP
jgi:NAD dependent epimerase/dehydratase family enzyme